MQNKIEDKEKLNNSVKFKLMYMFTYAPIGVLCPLIGQYLSTIGFTGTQIGIVTASSTAVAILASTFWGKMYSNSNDGRIVIFLLCLAAAAMAIVNSFITVFLLFVLTYSVMYFFQGPVMGLADAMVLETNENFASVRLYGSIGYALSVFIGGKVCDVYGLNKIFIIYAMTFVVGAVMAISVKKQRRGSQRQVQIDKESNTKKGIQFKELLKEKRALALIICGIFVFGTNVANNTYFGFLFREGGGSVSGLGIVFLLMVGSEAPFMFISPKLANKFTQEKIIAVAIIISVLRFGWYAFGPSSTWLMIMFFLQGMVNGVLLVEYVKYISSSVDVRLIGIAISAFYAISSNGGTILCNFFGGVAMDYFDAKGVYLLFSALNIVGIALYFMFGLHKEKSTSKGLKC